MNPAQHDCIPSPVDSLDGPLASSSFLAMVAREFDGLDDGYGDYADGFEELSRISFPPRRRSTHKLQKCVPCSSRASSAIRPVTTAVTACCSYDGPRPLTCASQRACPAHTDSKLRSSSDRYRQLEGSLGRQGVPRGRNHFRLLSLRLTLLFCLLTVVPAECRRRTRLRKMANQCLAASWAKLGSVCSALGVSTKPLLNNRRISHVQPQS